MNTNQSSEISVSTFFKNCQHISDVRFGKHYDIFYTFSHDGVGTISRLKSTSLDREDLSPPYNVRGTVGYGGGGFDLRNGRIVFCEKSGAVFINDPASIGDFIKIAPGFSRTSSPSISPDEKMVLFVFEQDEINGIGITATQKFGWPRQLAMGADFYMHPTWHPDGDRIAWVEWDHPYMPWDSSRIKIGRLSGMHPRLVEESFIAGKHGQSANQPQFSPDGCFLSYIQRNGEWDDLVLYELASRSKRTLLRGEGFHLRMPDWIQGLHSYRWSPDGKTIVVIQYHLGTASLATVNITSGTSAQIPTEPFVWLSQLDISEDGRLGALIGQTAYGCDQIVTVDLVNQTIQNKPSDYQNHIESMPELITFSNRDDNPGYAWFHPALGKQRDYGTAPCIIKIHSGPTSLKHAGYSPETEFFRQHGFSVAHLNYRGSVSFGYAYQYALERKWGEAEIEDTCDLIDVLERRDLATRDRMVVMGSSAGGFSVLQLLIQHPGLFKAAICSYAVSDLVDDAENTHKFEKYYHRFLTGMFPEEKERFIERSPITHIDSIQDPVALFHGQDDPVVSVKQSHEIYTKLKKNGVPCSLTVFEGEGHGFRRDENIERYYQEIIAFITNHI